jgi:hypothetical protein
MPARRTIRACMLALACAPAAHPRPASTQEEGLLELRLTAVAHARTIPVLVDSAGAPLVPLAQVLEFLEIPSRREAGAALLEWPPDAWDTRVELASRRIDRRADAFTVPAREWIEHGGDVYLSLTAMGRVVGGDLQVDWENLGLLVGGRTDYPVVRRLQNAGRRRAQGGAAQEPEDEELAVAYPARTGGATLGWALSAAMAGEELQGSGRAGVGLAVAGGALETGATLRASGGETGVGEVYGRYARSFPRARWVRQLELGDVTGDGLVTRPYFGVSVSNEPLYQPRRFGEALVRPVLPAGWEYEVYQGDVLVGVSSSGAGDPVLAPIGYGTTPVRIRLLGPAGQERTEELVFLVPAVQVPAGEWRYSLGGGACRQETCRALGYLDVRRGVTNSLTVGLGVDHTARDSGQATRPYGTVSWNPRPALRTELRVRPGALIHGTLQRHDRFGGWRLAGGWQREQGAALLPAPVWFGEANASIGTPLPGRGRVLGVYARARVPQGDSTLAAQWQAGLSSGLSRVRFGAQFESGYQHQDVLSLTAGSMMPAWLVPALRSWNLEGRLDLAGGSLFGAGVSTTFRPLDRASVSAGLTWYASGGPPGLSLSVVTRTRSAYLQSHAYSENGRQGAFASAGGGLAFGSGGGIVATPFETVGRGGVAGTVFYDEDGDGAWDPGEPPVPDVPVVVGGERAVSDAAGGYRAWGLMPYRVVGLSVDTLNLVVTNVSAGRPEYLLRPTPNVYARQDLPLLRTREVMGRLRWRGAEAGLGGITVEARGAGGAVHRVVTFSDGEFYFPRLPAGAYTLAVAETSLRALRAADVAPLPFTVPGDAADGPVSAPTLYLDRSP